MHNHRCSSLHLCKVVEAPVQAQSVKIEPPQSFGGKNEEDIDSWIFPWIFIFRWNNIPPKLEGN